MAWLIGMVIFFSMMKRFNNKFTDSRKLIYIIIIAFFVRGIGVFSFGTGEFGEIFDGVLNAVIVLSVVRLISLKFKEQKNNSDSSKTEEKNKKPDNPWEVFEELTESLSSKKKEIVQEQEPVVAPVVKKEIKHTTSSHAREIGEKAVKEYLTRRNYKVNIAKDIDFDFTAYDYQKKENQIKIITFNHDEKENLIELSADTYQKALNLGRNFMLFVITDTAEDDSSNYLGNYVKVYKVDSILTDIEFESVGNVYKISLAKLSRHASDWETNIK